MEICHYGNPGAQKVLIQMVDDHDLSFLEQEFLQIARLTENADFLLIAVKVDHWNDDLSPWAAPPVYGREGFGGGAGRTLAYLESEVIAPLRLEKPDREFYMGGYSLAGLFALWAACETDDFSGVAAVSPSVWFPGVTDYVLGKDTEPGIGHLPRTEAVYLSLGDREEKTQNAAMARVGDAIRMIYEHLRGCGVTCTLEWNPGNHFREPELRTAKGFGWVIGNHYEFEREKCGFDRRGGLESDRENIGADVNGLKS